SINLAVGMNKTFSIVIETEMNQVDNEALGYKKLTYTFTYDREAPSVNADLDSLQAIVTINGNPVDLLENLFLPTKLSYEVFVERSVGQVLLNASSSHNATISNLGTKPLASTEHVFEIAVKAEDGVTTKTYVVKIIRKDSNNKILDIGIDGIS